MATALKCLINFVDSSITYTAVPADYIELELDKDYLIWTQGSADVVDLMTHEPVASELNAAATIIDDSLDVTVPLCLLMDYSHDVGGSYYTHKVMGMSENKRYVFCFAFDGATATEPQLEAWDTTDRTTILKNVLGAGTALSSMFKGVCTTLSLPGASWVGVPIAGASNVLLLNGGGGALVGASNLYANLKIVIPANYANPAVESFITSVRYTWA